jgi:hypothetical protein
MNEENDDDLSMEMDLSEVSPDDREGGSTVPTGQYHARLESIQRVSDMNSHLKLRFKLLAGTTAAGVGQTFQEKLFLTEKARPRLRGIATRMGLLTTANCGERVTINWGDVIGKEFVIEIVDHEFEGKNGKVKTTQLNFVGVYQLNDERVKDVPRAKGQQPAAPKSTKAKPTGDWEDL